MSSISLKNCRDLLTTEDIHELTQISLQVVRRLLASGQLPGVKIGARWFVPKSELEKFLSDQLDVNHE
ncbi:MAG: helix-turn-helix domain-containing protein [Eggerthellaceae bacterium]|nr:helix-turn-helix domain-containing protein [Eggerthellaceae bacterium]